MRRHRARLMAGALLRAWSPAYMVLLGVVLG